MKKMSLVLDKIYESKKVENQPEIGYNKDFKKRPSWVKINLDKKIIFIKMLSNGEAFWYRRYFEDYFFPFEATSEDMKSFYNETATEYEMFVPHQKEVAIKLVSFLKEQKVNKDSKILDLGAGTGLVTQEIAREGYSDLTLLDISNKELELAKKKVLLKKAKYIISDLTKDEIKEKYDLVVETLAFNELLEKNILILLNNIKNSLNKGGLFIMIDRHLFPELDSFFVKIKSGKFPLKTPAGVFDYYFYIGRK